eukprot:6197785-Pleurochrysis_carterae.AAC.1
MEWARTLFGECMSKHCGTKFGCFLALTEHMPSRQIRVAHRADEHHVFMAKCVMESHGFSGLALTMILQTSTRQQHVCLLVTVLGQRRPPPLRPLRTTTVPKRTGPVASRIYIGDRNSV